MKFRCEVHEFQTIKPALLKITQYYDDHIYDKDEITLWVKTDSVDIGVLGDRGATMSVLSINTIAWDVLSVDDHIIGIVVNNSDLLSVLKIINGKSRVTFKFSSTTKELEIIEEYKNTHTYKLKVLDQNPEEIKDLEIPFENRFVVLPKDLLGYINKLLKLKPEIVSFELDEVKARLIGHGKIPTIIEINRNDENVLDYYATRPLKTTVKAEYLKELVTPQSFGNMFDTVNVQIYDEGPIRFVLHAPGVDFTYYIAPYKQK